MTRDDLVRLHEILARHLVDDDDLRVDRVKMAAELEAWAEEILRRARIKDIARRKLIVVPPE